MEIRILAKEFNNIIDYDEVTPLHIDYEAGDTITITGDEELLDDFRGGRIMLTFEECKKPYHLVFENGQKKMPHNFAENNAMGNLLSFSAPDLLELGEFSLAYCPELKSVNLPSLKIICRGAFYSCKSLTEIDIPNVKEIDDEAFSGCESLEDIDAPQVEFIGYDVFYDCLNLQRVILPSISKMEGIFQDCKNFREINLSSVKIIGEEAFQNCINLKSVKAPEAVEIQESAFQGCDNLEFLEIFHVETICDYAFEGCKSLKSINCPNIKNVGESAFFGCESLSEVIMPSLRKIDSMGFYSCPIKIINIPEDVEAEYDSFSLIVIQNKPAIKNIQDRAIKKSFNRLLENAAKAEAMAQFALGCAYADGKYELELDGTYISCDTEKNINLAIEYWKKAAAQKHRKAMYELSLEYLSGENIQRNEAEAMKLLISSAEAGFAKAQFELADYYREGKYLEQNIGKARKWYCILLKKGYAEALERLKNLHRENPESQQDMPDDEVEAVYFKAEKLDENFNR